MESKEMNFWDLCVACGRAVGRGCVAFWHLLERMIRLTYRYWWVVVPIVALFICGALYYSRYDNLKFKVNAIALLNGPTIQQFEQSYVNVQTGQMLPPEAPISQYVWGKMATDFKTFRVVDCVNDETADFIDFKHKSKPTDTVNVQMQDRLCLQFRLKACNMAHLPAIEHALLDYLNSNPTMQQAYVSYMHNLREEVAFNHRQAQKLDSLTSCYYFQPASETTMRSSGVSFYGDREIKLFLKDIYEQHEHVRRFDQRLQLATAPITLENHFSAMLEPVNGRTKCLVIFFLIGWLFACGIAEIIDKRKVICAWLKQ